MLLNSYLPCITPAQYVDSTTKVKEPMFFNVALYYPKKRTAFAGCPFFYAMLPNLYEISMS